MDITGKSVRSNKTAIQFGLCSVGENQLMWMYGGRSHGSDKAMLSGLMRSAAHSRSMVYHDYGPANPAANMIKRTTIP